jgi:hypothetical protein
MSTWLQQQANELRQRISTCMHRRSELEGARATPAGAAAVAGQIRALDADTEALCRDLYMIERKLKKDGP